MTIEATHLGKLSSYPVQYDPSVLVAVPRKLNREMYEIDGENLPFEGIDVWHAYEFSFLTLSGMPVVGLLKITYPAHSPYLVESKSIKLYLNSFNMEKMGKSVVEGVKLVIETIKKDLSSLLKCAVEVNYFNHSDKWHKGDFEPYCIIEDQIQNVHFADYEENVDLLDEVADSNPIQWGSHLLRSNCKITNQPDWGTIYLYMKSDTRPSPEAFLKYIVSLRNENHFHEEICEMVYQRLFQKYQPESIMVTCLYTRRGGIDINPVRANTAGLFPASLSNPLLKSKVSFRQ